jgi:hypothetical protein
MTTGEQTTLLASETANRLETFIECNEDTLVIPEGLATVPCTHGIHKFAGKFIPNLPRYFIREVLPKNPERVLLDPFCGSGTTIVEAALEGRPFIGLDIDPLSILISSAKTWRLGPDELSEIESFWANHNFEILYPDVIPTVPNLSHWFTPRAITELSSIKWKCQQLPPRLRTFCLVVFSSIIRRVSNADDQTQKTYVSHTLPKTPPLASNLFPLFLKRALSGMRQYSSLLASEPKGRVFQGDAANLTGLAFDDIITSPPYIDSIDYVYNQMLEYFWLMDELGIYTHENYKAARKQPMGFRKTSEPIGGATLEDLIGNRKLEFEDICSKIGQKSPKEESAVRAFFFDYARHVKSARTQQRLGGYYVSVVGNSLIRGVQVPTVELIERLHKNSGYTLVNKWTYQIRRHYMKFPRKSNSGTIKQDSVLVFKAQ